jgi:hypothetical protein
MVLKRFNQDDDEEDIEVGPAGKTMACRPNCKMTRIEMETAKRHEWFPIRIYVLNT